MTKFPIYRSIGRNIKKARLAAGMTQKQLGASVGLSREAIASIEQGRSAVKVHQLLQITGALGMKGGGLEKVGRAAPRQKFSIAGGGSIIPLQADIIRLEAAATQLKLVSLYGRKDRNRLAELQRRGVRPIIEMIGMLRVEGGNKAFSCYSRQYRIAGDDDDCEDFATFEQAQAWARKETEGRAGVRVWINNVEV